ncbi:MAG: hypothetical protein IPM46_05765 [Flavobacteriales bacterium]|nr:hypothetical protein [Flavobacteriales bacterium]
MNRTAMVIRSRIASIVVGAGMGCLTYAQTYFHPTVGQQSTYTGACMQTTCSGTYYDNGGAAGNYAANVNNIFRTFCPNQAGMCVRATFTQFAMNDTWFLCFGPNSCCDYLQILNGPVQNSPAIFSNCTASPGTITASNPSGCLTFRFVSDGSVQLAGWTATISCVPCAGGPSGTSNSDCAYATPICIDTQISDSSPGPGISAEGCSGCVTSENYTNWYRIQIQTSGTLAFTIDPNNNNDDFDPVVFGPNVPCGALGTPIRCSYAINAGNGNTGLGNGATDTSEDVFGNQWVSPINAIAGQTYYVMINGWSANSGQNGFLLDWTGTAGLNCSLLPVELIYFTGTCESGQAMLEWGTGAEVNSSHFVVERSADALEWKPAGVVEAAHHSQHATSYLFTDPTMLDGRDAYYRLRQVDLDEGDLE